MRTFVFALLAWTAVCGSVFAQSSDLEVFPQAVEMQFQQGYDVYSNAGKLLKTVPGPTSATIRAKASGKPFAVGEVYLSDWSFDQRQQGKHANWVVPKSEAAATALSQIAAPSGVSAGLIVYPTIKEMTFPEGYNVFSDDGQVIKTVPGPTSIALKGETIGKTFANGTAYFSDWSYDQMQQGKEPNWVLPKNLKSNLTERLDAASTLTNWVVSVVPQKPHSCATAEELGAVKGVLLNDFTLITVAPGRDIGTTEIKIWDVKSGRCIRTIPLQVEVTAAFPSESGNSAVLIAPANRIQGGAWLEISRNSEVADEREMPKPCEWPYSARAGGLVDGSFCFAGLVGNKFGMWGDCLWMLAETKEAIIPKTSTTKRSIFYRKFAPDWKRPAHVALDTEFSNDTDGQPSGILRVSIVSAQRGVSKDFTIRMRDIRNAFSNGKVQIDEIDGLSITDDGEVLLSLKDRVAALVLLNEDGSADVRPLNKDLISERPHTKFESARRYVADPSGIQASMLSSISSVDLQAELKHDMKLHLQAGQHVPVFVATKSEGVKNLPTQVAINNGAKKIVVSTKSLLTGIRLDRLSSDFQLPAAKGTAFFNPLLAPSGDTFYWAGVENLTYQYKDPYNREEHNGTTALEDLEKINSRVCSAFNLRQINMATWLTPEYSKKLLTKHVWQGSTANRRAAVFASIADVVVVDLELGTIVHKIPNPFLSPDTKLSADAPQSRIFGAEYRQSIGGRPRYSVAVSGQNNWLMPMFNWHRGVFYAAFWDEQSETLNLCRLIENVKTAEILKSVSNSNQHKFSYNHASNITDVDISADGTVLCSVSTKWGGSGVRVSLHSSEEEVTKAGRRVNWIDDNRYFVGSRYNLEVFDRTGSRLSVWPDNLAQDSDHGLWQGIDPWSFDPVSGTFAFASSEGHVSIIKLEGDSLVEKARVFLDDAGQPLFVTPDNFYALRSGKISAVAFSKQGSTYPFEQFDLRLNRPDIVLQRLGAPDEAVAIAKQLREKRLKRMGVTEEMLKPDFHVPELEIVGDIPTTTDAGEINLSIKASDSKYPLERLKVFVNNVPVNGRDGELLREESKEDPGLLGRITGALTGASTGPQNLEHTIPIKLAAGRNKIQMSVLNNAGAESLYANAEVNCTAKRPKPALYAVAMGVSEYSNPEWNLKYAAKDARDVLARLKAKAVDQYGEVKELLLTDRDVTKENLAKVREFLKGAAIDDTVLMFAAGHGLLDSKYDYYFGTSDIDFNNPADKGIAFEDFDDILADLPCLKKSLLVDTCHAGELDQDEKTLLASADSGGSAALPTGKGIAMRSIGTRGMNVKAIEGARGASEWYDRLQGLFVDLRRGSGSTILTSAAGAEYALESSEQQNGLFTYAVLEALDGKKDADTNKDGSVQMSELGEYVKKRVSELTNNKQTPNTRRVNLEGDFTLAKTK